ncbi:MAG: MFS transporter [Candidatus Bathyarchaeota archaeon]|nr:MFS transporter [Candidatus Bathyarchaeota archaeon]
MNRSVNRKALFIILAASTLAVMAGSIISPVISLMQGNLQGADENNIRFVITTHALFIAVFSPIFGSVIDKIGPKKPFILGLVLYGIAGASGLFITDITAMIISRAVLGIAVAAIANPIIILILNVYKNEECNKIMGWQASASSIGGVIWPLLGGALGVLAWNLPFGIYLAGIPTGLLAWLLVPNVSENKTGDENQAAKEKSVLKTLKRKPFILAIYGLGLWMMALLYTNVTFIPQLLATDFGVHNSLIISAFISVMGIAAAAISFMYRSIKSRFSYNMIAFTALGLWSVGLVFLSQVIGIASIIIAVILFGMGQGMIMPTLNLWVGELTDTCIRGRMVSYLTTFLFIGQFLPPIIFNPIFSAFSFSGVFLTSGIVCTILTALFIINWRKNKN